MVKLKEEIYQHFRPEEASMIDSLWDLAGRAQDEYRPILTHFLNPRQQYLAKVVADTIEVKLAFAGGLDASERKRALFYPEYYQPEDSDFSLALLEIKYPVKFAQLQHGRVLGTLANCGLDREVLGDILTDGVRFQVVCEQEIATYLENNIDRIGKIKVRLVELALTEIINPLTEWEQTTLILASKRCDTVIAAAYNLSRKHVKDLLSADKVNLNWVLQNKADLEVGLHDIISVRGYGRIRLDELTGISKKGKLIAQVSVLRKTR